MNYKRHKRRHSRYKAQELGTSLKGWTYGRAIAKEVIYRREFRDFKRSIRI